MTPRGAGIHAHARLVPAVHAKVYSPMGILLAICKPARRAVGPVSGLRRDERSDEHLCRICEIDPAEVPMDDAVAEQHQDDDQQRDRYKEPRELSIRWRQLENENLISHITAALTSNVAWFDLSSEAP